MSNTLSKIAQAYQILNESILSEAQLQEIGMGQAESHQGPMSDPNAGPKYKTLADLGKSLAKKIKDIHSANEVEILAPDHIVVYMEDCMVDLIDKKISKYYREIESKISSEYEVLKGKKQYKLSLDPDQPASVSNEALKQAVVDLIKEDNRDNNNKSIPGESLNKLVKAIEAVDINEASEEQIEGESFDEFTKELAKDLKKAKWKIVTENTQFSYDITDLVSFVLNIVKVEGANSFIKMSMTEIDPVDVSRSLYKPQDVTIALIDFSAKTKKDVLARIEKNFKQMAKTYESVLDGRLKSIEKTLKEVKKI